jgi:hypothetical protein
MDHLSVCEYYVTRVRLPCELSTLTVGKGGRQQTMGPVVITVGTIADRNVVSARSRRPKRSNAFVIAQTVTCNLDGSSGSVYSGFECLDRGGA